MSDSRMILKRRWANIHSYINPLSSEDSLETEINYVIKNAFMIGKIIFFKAEKLLSKHQNNEN